MSDEIPQSTASPYVRRHLLFGWWSFCLFICLGLLLDALHAFKVGWYLDAPYATRRLMWTLGHAHGTLFSLVHVAFAATMFMLPGALEASRRLISACLISATVLVPGGFFLGGSFLFEGDPGLGIWLVPVGALLMLASVVLIAVRVGGRGGE